jgi:hypothetical protein
LHELFKFLIICEGIELESEITKDFARFENEGLIKSTDLPVKQLDGEQKAALNRRGNQFFNQGEIENARRIFVTTGYSDGLTRVGDYYAMQGRELDALKLYWLAHNRRKADPLISKLASLIGTFL